MEQVYECATCGIVAKKKGHLCNPVDLENKGDYCGHSSSLKTAMMCSEETRRLDYECGNCGRPAESADLLCTPRKV